MDKRKAHYPLAKVKTLIREGCYTVTRTALSNAARDFGFVQSGQLAECVLGLEIKNFYKSMTTIHDNTLWQDVYHQPVQGEMAYVKIQIVSDNTLIISFKRLEENQR